MRKPLDDPPGAWHVGDIGTFYWTHPTLGRRSEPGRVVQVWPLVIQLPGIQVQCLSSGQCVVPGLLDGWFLP